MLEREKEMNQLTLSECTKRKLDETYVVVYAIKNEINIKRGELIEKNNIYTLIGIDIKGFRQFINIYQDKTNNNRFWLDCFEALKSRGLKNILFLSVDDNRNMKRTAKIAFPDIVFVDSITDITPKFFKYTPERNAMKIASKLHSLYTQKTLTEYKETIKVFNEEYNNAIQQKLSQKYLSNIESLYKYSSNVRCLLFKHTANLEFYDTIRLAFNSHSNYVLDLSEIYDKLGNINNFFGFTSFKKKEWILILNDLIQMYPKINFI